MKKQITFILTLLLAASLAACSTQAAVVTEPADTGAQNTATVVELDNNSSATEESTSPVADVEITTYTHEASSDYTWEVNDEMAVVLNGVTASAESGAVQIDGSIVTISAGGTYRLSGNLTDGQVIVNSPDKEVVRLILDGVEIASSTSASIYIADAEKVIIILAEDSQNILTDGSAYVFANVEDEEPNAAIFSAADLTLYGNGELTVNANFNDGIASKDGLILASGTITINAADDGVRGKDYMVVKDGTISITATRDGLKADNDSDAALGYVEINNGEISITAGGDAVTAQTGVLINDGNLILASGGGSGAWLDETLSAKGIKGLTSVTINGGTFSINSADDSIHSNGKITINNGAFQLASADDGMHADTSLTINGGEITINQSYEGIESALITINDGNIHINASDDGINVASGVDGSGGMFGGRPGVQPGTDLFAAGGDYYLYINGGYVVVNADGDGLDANGGIVMTDGVVLVNGPTNNGNGALDYRSNFTISGGLIVAVGSSGMAQAASADSTQNSVLLNLDSAVQAGTVINIQDGAGNSVLSYQPARIYQSILFSSSALESGKNYTVNLGGVISGDLVDRLATTDGYYLGGSQYTSFTVSSAVTVLGAISGFGRGGGGGRR